MGKEMNSKEKESERESENSRSEVLSRCVGMKENEGLGTWMQVG